MMPDAQTLMLPLFRQVAEGKEYKFGYLMDTLAANFI